jgi:hypothetical protein
MHGTKDKSVNRTSKKKLTASKNKSTTTIKKVPKKTKDERKIIEDTIYETEQKIIVIQDNLKKIDEGIRILREEIAGTKKGITGEKAERVTRKDMTNDKRKNISDGEKFVLRYLQNHALDLRRKINVADVRYESNPPRVVLVMNGPKDIKKPQIVYEGKKIEVELEFVQPTEMNIPLGSTTTNPDSTYHREFGGDSSKVLGISEAIGPHSAEKPPIKNLKAYNAWLDRHLIIKKGD